LDCGYRLEKPPGQARNDGRPVFSYLGVSKPLIMSVYRKNTFLNLNLYRPNAVYFRYIRRNA
jgi:hypothetical protein